MKICGLKKVSLPTTLPKIPIMSNPAANTINTRLFYPL